jgi:hypothetical protein
MTMIAKNNNVVTLINVFTVRPEQQQRLVDVLVEATEAVMKYQPGYVSANIHKSWRVRGSPTTPSGEVERHSRRCLRIQRRMCICRKQQG